MLRNPKVQLDGSPCNYVLFSERICVTVSGAAKGKPCIFPFKFNGVVYSECTWNQAHLTEHKAWCSTLVDASGTHVGGQGKWGNCGAGCPVPPDDRVTNGTAAATPKDTAPAKTDGKTMKVSAKFVLHMYTLLRPLGRDILMCSRYEVPVIRHVASTARSWCRNLHQEFAVDTK